MPSSRPVGFRGDDGRQRGRTATTVLRVRAGAAGPDRARGAGRHRCADRGRVRPGGVGAHPAPGRQLALGAVPHRHRGVPPLRGDRPALSLQRVRRAGGGRGQGPPEEAAAGGVPARHRRPAAGRRGGRPHLHALGPRQAGRQRLRAADRARRPARRARVRRHHPADARQRHRQGQVPLARRRAGAGRHRARPQGGAEAGRQGDHRRHQQAAAARSWRRSASSRT